MTTQRIHANLGPLDIATPDDINEVMAHRFDAYLRDRYRTIKLMKLPIISVQATAAGNLTLVNPNLTPWCGPDSGFVWCLKRVLIASSGGYAAPGITGSSSLPLGPGNAFGSVATPGATTVIATASLPATTIPVVWQINWGVGIQAATATNANNFKLTVGGPGKAISVNALSIGTYAQPSYQYIQPVGNAVTVTVQSILADITATYAASMVFNATALGNSAGAGDDALVSYLYAGSDASLNQNTILAGSDIYLGRSWFPSSEGAWLFPGEQVYAALSNVTSGYTYTLTGVAVEVASEMVAKIIG